MQNTGEIRLLYGNDIPRVQFTGALAWMRYAGVVDPDVDFAESIDTALP